MTFGEYRAKHGLPTQIEENDFLLNSTWIQYKQAMNQQQQGGFMENMIQQQQNNGDEISNSEERSIFKDFTEENPFVRDLERFALEKGWTN